MFCLPSKGFAVVLLASLAGLHPLRTQAAEAVLTQVKEVLALTEEIAEAGTKSVKLRGGVTYITANQDEFTLHDGEASLSVMMPGSGQAPEAQSSWTVSALKA
jgi:hypothetical protein